MARIVIFVAVLTIALLLWYKIKSATGEDRKKLIIKSVIGAIIGTLVLLAATGKLNVITAIIGSIVALIPKVAGYLRYLPVISKLYSSATQQGKPNAQHQQATRNSGDMDKDEALKVLGLEPGASREQVLAAHKRMMQKVHPDRGGSDHLASQINKAKDTLLG